VIRVAAALIVVTSPLHSLTSAGEFSMSVIAWFRQLSLTISMLQKMGPVNTGGRNHGYQ
jgi:hypothetical protein